MKPFQMYQCAVSVATVWTSPHVVRQQDAVAILNPPNISQWLATMSDEERLDLCLENRIQTQLLYGEPVLVEEVVEDWAKIFAVWQPTHKDQHGYPGWVPLRQLKKSEPLQDVKGLIRVKVRHAQLRKLDGQLDRVISFNSILPYVAETAHTFILETPAGRAVVQKNDVSCAPTISQFDQQAVSQAVERGSSFLGLPYLWGGMSAYGYDCSGFTYNMMKAIGYWIPRDASDQGQIGEALSIHERTKWQKGDLLFFADQGLPTAIRHVGFYAGNGMLLHAPSTGQSIEYLALSGSVLEQEICAVRRVAANECNISSIHEDLI